MRITGRLCIVLLLLGSAAVLHGQELLKDEALSAWEYLNRVRQNPSAHSDEIGVDLDYVTVRPELEWDENLADAAERKALDMASRDYFAHVDPDGYGMNHHMRQAGYELREDWTTPRSSNYFESISYTQGYAAEGSGVAAIRQLILDRNTNPPGHRNHLLGIEDFWSNCTDAGIGIARIGDRIYVSVLVAKEDF
jgi:uncharacterized protein YkwD